MISFIIKKDSKYKNQELGRDLFFFFLGLPAIAFFRLFDCSVSFLGKKKNIFRIALVCKMRLPLIRLNGDSGKSTSSKADKPTNQHSNHTTNQTTGLT